MIAVWKSQSAHCHRDFLTFPPCGKVKSQSRVDGLSVQIRAIDGAVSLHQECHWCCEENFILLLDGMLNGTDDDLCLPSTRFSQQHPVFPPVVSGWRQVLTRVVQEPFPLGQALHNILIDGGLVWQQGVQLVYGQRLQAADRAVHHPLAPEMQDVVQGQHVGWSGDPPAQTEFGFSQDHSTAGDATAQLGQSS